MLPRTSAQGSCSYCQCRIRKTVDIYGVICFVAESWMGSFLNLESKVFSALFVMIIFAFNLSHNNYTLETFPFLKSIVCMHNVHIICVYLYTMHIYKGSVCIWVNHS